MSALVQVGQIARRSILRTARQPANIIFPFVFPTALLAVTSAGLSSATKLPGFPSDSFLAFFLAFPFIQGALFATMNAGTDLARDIQTGFLNRLALTPLRGGSLIVGQLGGIAVLAFVQNCYYLTVGLIVGVRLESGIVGGIVLIILATGVAIAFGALGAFFALRTGSGEAVQGLFPLLFVGLFLSSMNLPRNLIEADWFRTVATFNPISYLIEGLRSLIIAGWDWQALALAFGVAVTLAIGSLAAATWALTLRLTRTCRTSSRSPSRSRGACCTTCLRRPRSCCPD